MLTRNGPGSTPAATTETANGNVNARTDAAITLRSVIKTFETPAGTFTALKGIDLEIRAGDFVAIIGKSGSGKSTLLNMITGIDRPTSGEAIVAGTPIHALTEDEMAHWRGRNLGIVFQFFQLLPTLTLLENVTLPMDFCGVYPRRHRKERALELLAQVGLAEHANKLPSAVSGGQQQRAAIARALANDPPLVVADEPTGNLDSRMADSIFRLFEQLAANGKTVVMVTHDGDFASRARRSVIIADGEVVNQYVVQALPALDLDQLAVAATRLSSARYEPGQIVVRQGDQADNFYVITSGLAEVLLERPGGQPLLVNRLAAGAYFGEIALLTGGTRTATVRAGPEGLEVVALSGEVFRGLVNESEPTRQEIDAAIRRRLEELGKVG